ncbi:MAG: choice-of-anchor L domain-containing protein [Bacteroidetes bacterium]|nr:choice-of-anchor L domain-containing protein [Bacteroidota bacterium]
MRLQIPPLAQLLLLLSLILPPLTHVAKAQLVVREDIPLQELVRNHFIGGGAQVSNLQFRGFPRAIGYFDGTKSNIGISSGVLLTTGWVGFAVGPNSKDDISFAALAAGDPDLAQIVNALTFDAAVLQFDFVPYQDSVTFEYVFGSDEYTEYVGSPFNDVFAFFISGPGITGKQNIALIPGTAIPVSINNVNHILNTQYYVNNYLGTSVEYDGFTKVFKAVAHVTPCETYHLKLAITDVADPFLDSGVFLRSGSFDAGDALSVIGLRDAPEGGCQSGLIEILRGGNLEKSLTVTYEVRGSATNGTDYTTIGNTVTFLPGQDSYIIPINALADGIADNGEWVTIYIDDLCKTGLVRDSIRIFEAAPLQIDMPDDVVLCEGDEVDLAAAILGGSGVLRYHWDDPAQSEQLSIRVSPSATRMYIFTVRDSLTGCEALDSVRVRVDSLPLIDAGLDTIRCPNGIVQIGTPVLDAISPYTVHWTPENGLSDPNIEMPFASPSVTTTYVLTLRTEAGCIVRDTVVVTVSDIAFEAGPDTTICQGSAIVIGSPATNGRPPYSYEWTPPDGLSDPSIATPTASPSITTMYHVVMQSGEGCIIEDSVLVTVNAIVFDAGPDRRICRGSSVVIGDTAWSPSPPVRYLWTPAIGLDDSRSPMPTASPANPTEYVVTVTDSRGCVVYDTVIVTVNDVAIDAGSNLSICPGESVQLQGSVSRGTNPFLWRWSPSAGLSDSTIRNPVVSPTSSTWYRLTVIDGNGCVDHDSVLVTVWPQLQVEIDVEGSTVLCEGDSVVLDAGSGYLSYSWSTGATTQRIVVRDAGTYVVAARTLDGCDAGVDSIAVTVTNRPVPSIAGPLTLCAGDSVRYSVSEIPGAVYQWQVFGGFILEGNDTHSITVRWDTPGTYEVGITELFGSATCRGDTSITVTVLSAPQPLVTASGPVEFCEGGSVRLDAPMGFKSYRWSTGDTTSSIEVNGPGSYYVTVTNAIGCTGTSPAIQVTVFPLPNPQIVAQTPIPVCEGDSVLLGVTGSYSSYAWSTGETGATIVVHDPGTFTLRVRTSEGCEGVAQPITVGFLPLPEPEIVADGPLEFCEGDSVQLSTTESYARYAWSSGEAASSILVRRSGTYSVTVRNADACEAVAVPVSVIVHPLPPPPVISRPAADLESTPAIAYQWYEDESGVLNEIPGATGQRYPGLPDVWYRVRIHDVNGCTAISEPFRYEDLFVAASTIALPQLQATPGDPVTIALTMPEQNNLGRAGVKRYEARIRFNESMLVPIGNTPFGDVIDGERIISVTGNFESAAEVLAELQFVATLGTASETPLVIESFSWDQDKVLITRIDGILRMDVCREGGERLFDSEGRIALEPNHPNPFNSMTMLTYETIERGRTELFVLDMLGRRVATLVDDDREPGRYRVYFNAGELSSGVYTAVLRTPTQVKVQRMKLIK